MPPRRRPAGALEEAPPRRGGAVRRRPAAREAGEAEAEGELRGEVLRLASTGVKFERGEKTKCEEVPLEVFRRGLPICLEGLYWGAQAMVAGLVESLYIRTPKDVELHVKVQGTTEENLLRWATGHPGLKLRVHLCGDSCPEKLEAEDLIHGMTVSKRTGEDDPWMANLIEEVARPEGSGAAPLLVGEREEGRGKGSSAKAAAEEEKSEAKKKKKKKRRSEERGRSPEKSKEKIDLKSGARKELKEVFGGTGLDPDPRFRRRYAVKAQKKTKKRKRDSYSTGSSSSGKTTTSESVEVFEEQQKVRRLSKRAPGVLAALAMREMQTSLLTATGGIWQQDQTAIQPLAVQYFRQSLAPRLQGGPGREGLTLCWAIDLALQGRMAECVDALVQRLKSVEMVSQGSAWQIAQRLEVLPPERPLLSSRGEAKEAIREQKEEQKTRNEASKGKSKSDTWHWRDPGSEGKGKETKGKGKKGKDKGVRGDQKK